MALKGPNSEPNEDGEEDLAVVGPLSGGAYASRSHAGDNVFHENKISKFQEQEGTNSKVRAPISVRVPNLPGELPGSASSGRMSLKGPKSARSKRGVEEDFVGVDPPSILPLPVESGTGGGDTMVTC
jgi:hypothetical protein